MPTPTTGRCTSSDEPPSPGNSNLASSALTSCTSTNPVSGMVVPSRTVPTDNSMLGETAKAVQIPQRLRRPQLGEQLIIKERAATRLRRYNLRHHTVTVCDQYRFTAGSEARRQRTLDRIPKCLGGH